MTKVVLHTPNENLIREIVGLLPVGENDYSRYAIIFPGKRPAHFIRKHLAERERRSIIPPKIFSIDLFIEEIFRSQVNNSAKSIDLSDAIAILFEIHNEIEERLGGTHFRSLDGFIPLAIKIYQELEELVFSGESVEQLKRVFSTIPYGRIHSIGLYYERFYAQLKSLGLTSRATMYRAVAENIRNIDLSDYDRIILAGFYALTSIDRQIFSHLLEFPNTQILYQEGVGLRPHLENLGISQESVQSGREETDNTKPDVHLISSVDTHGQVFALAELLKGKIERSEAVDESSVIVLPSSEALFPVYQFVLPLLKKGNYNIALGYPSNRTQVFGFLTTLSDLVCLRWEEKYEAKKYLKFIRFPYVKNIRYGSRTDVTRILSHQIEQYLNTRRGGAWITLEEIEKNQKIFEKALQMIHDKSSEISHVDLQKHLKAIHNQTIRAADNFKTIGEFSKRCVDVLTYIYKNSTAHLHPLFRDYALAIIEAFDHVNGSLLAGKNFDERNSYVTFIENILSQVSVPFSGTPLAGVQVLGLLETRNLKFDNVYMLDVNDDVIPGNSGKEMLIPQGVREKLGMETYHEREKLSEYYFDLLTRGAREVFLFYTENGKKEKSRFIEKILWNDQKRANSLDPDQRIRKVHYQISLSNTRPKPIPKTDQIVGFLKEFTFSASSVDCYLKCPIRFYFRFILRLDEKREITSEVDEMQIGTFVHSVLYLFHRNNLSRPLKHLDLSIDLIEEIVEEEFPKAFGAEELADRLLIKNQIKHRLREFVEKYEIPVSQKYRREIVLLEQRHEVVIGGYKLEGKIDRVEKRGDLFYVLDYKTGNTSLGINFKKLEEENRETWIKTIQSFQLPIYAILYRLISKVDLDHVYPAYLLLGSPDMNESIEAPLVKNTEGLKEGVELSERILLKILDEIMSKEVPFNPTSELNKECKGCSYNIICGTQWIQ